MPLIPTVLWADRSDKLYLTLDVQDAQAPSVKLDNNEESKTGKLSFSATAGAEKQEYALELELNKEIDVSASQISISPRHIFLVIVKKDKGYWPRLTKEPSRNLTHIKVDWDKWVDEDEEGTGKDKVDLSQFNLNSFEGMGGMGGLGGDDDEDGMGGFAPPGDDDEDDSDNDELPDLVQ